MNITPKDILEKEFSKKFNGYDQEQVDEYLDEIIKQFESLLEENENVIAKNEEMKAEIARLKLKADKLENIEEKLMATVITAQRNATMYIEKAEVQAQKIMDIANQNAKAVIESTQLRLGAIDREIRKYERQVKEYRNRFRLFLEEQYANLDAKIEGEEVLGQQAGEITNAIGSLSSQMANIDTQSHNTNIKLNEILKESKNETAHRFEESTANLQEIVNEIIDEK